MLSRKVILTGSFGVGKTSLFSRFINNTFSDRYITTIGVKVDKKSLEIDGQEVSILLWDIAGEVTQNKVPKSYFLGASAIIYVFDLTRPSTYKNIKVDIDYLNKILPSVNILIVGNKKDLLETEKIKAVEEDIGYSIDLFTSAKTGENVENLFDTIGRGFLD